MTERTRSTKRTMKDMAAESDELLKKARVYGID